MWIFELIPLKDWQHVDIGTEQSRTLRTTKEIHLDKDVKSYNKLSVRLGFFICKYFLKKQRVWFYTYSKTVYDKNKMEN